MPHLQLLILNSQFMKYADHTLIATELRQANAKLAQQYDDKEKRAAELIIANQELAFQNQEKEQRAAELLLANQELVFQHHEKEKRAAELLVANEELAYQNSQKEDRALELIAINLNLKKAESYQKQYIKGLEKMMYLISHCVRQPICQIVGISNLLETPNSVDEVKKMVGYVKASAASLDTFTKDLTKIMKKLKDKSQLKQDHLGSAYGAHKG